MEADFRWILVATAVATASGAALVPTFERIFSKAVLAFFVYRSIPRLIFHSFSTTGILHIRDSFHLTAPATITTLHRGQRLPIMVIGLKALVTAIWTVGVLASLYAGYLEPELRVTASSLLDVRSSRPAPDPALPAVLPQAFPPPDSGSQ